MDRFETLQLCIAVSLLGSVCRCWEASTPQTVKAIKKSCVLVKCSTVPYKKVNWYKYKSTGYPVVYSNDQSEIMNEFKGRTSLKGNAQNGDCTLRINNVQREDSEVGLYVWVWKNDNDHKGFYARTTKIEILEPRDPDITMESTQVEGKAFTAKCKFRTSCPTPPQLTWMGLSGTSDLNHTNIENTLWDTELTTTFTVTRQDHGKELICKALLSGQDFQSTAAPLNVSYPPSILPGTFCSMENRLLKCVCQAVAKPNAVISWTIDGSSELSSAFNTITLDNSSMTVSELTGPQGWGGNVTCTATNIAGTKVFQMYINFEGVDSLVLEAGVGAACVLGIIGLVTAIVICKKRRCAEPPKDLITVQQVRFDRSKVSHDYGLSSDEDLYVNAVQATQKLKEQDAESCVYENYDRRP